MIVKFDNLDDYSTFAEQAAKDGVRPKLRSGLEIEVPDGYNPKGKTSAQLDAELQPGPDPGEEAVSAAPQTQEPTTVATEKPTHGARRSDWVNYAEKVGIDTTDLTKAEIIEKVEGA